MEHPNYEVDPDKPFAESLIWQLNRDYYLKMGMAAWKDGPVPHHLTSNSLVGKTYAELIFGFLKDLAHRGYTKEKVYILELGAGHGRLAFHILKHLERLIDYHQSALPPFCYVLSDFVEENLNFFYQHAQFQKYYEEGLLDVAYFDAMHSDAIQLRRSKMEIVPGSLQQPILGIANYFFDSIPSDLFYLKNTKMFACSVSVGTAENPDGMDEAMLLQKMELAFQNEPVQSPPYKDAVLNNMLENYRQLVFDTYLFFPRAGLQCLANLHKFSKKGLMVLSMDKGFHEIYDLENVGKPDIVTHGSMSIWVNFHAFKVFCEQQGGTAYFPVSATSHSQVCCLLFLPGSEQYHEINTAYQRFVNDFGPDDFNGLKKLTYRNIAGMNLTELISVLRLSGYDSTMFANVLPQIKQVSRRITFHNRKRLAETMHQTWEMYFSLNESLDLAYEMGGIFYDLGFYTEALNYFQHSVSIYGNQPDVYYNRALCYYQLREDALFLQTVDEAKAAFPAFDKFRHLDSLDLGAA